jgi:C-3',4' desaturase CrtD
MAHEVVVVGAGIGGLTTAALLAARGVNVCLLEKESRVGGCLTSVQKFDYQFETSAGLYSSWQPGEIHERVFAELPSDAPAVAPLSPAYIVRLPDQTDIALAHDDEEFEAALRAGFPECAQGAVNFYRELMPIGEALLRVSRRFPDLATASRMRRMRAAATEARLAPRIMSAMTHTTAQHLAQTSARFRRFIDAQLQIFAQCDGSTCAYLYAAVALAISRRSMYGLRGGAAALTDALLEALKKSGGTVRLDTTALRLSYDSSGRATGVDLLSGETIPATRAIVSNLTAWDTYGKLVRSAHTPDEVRKQLKNVRGWGAYLLFLGMDEETGATLPADHILALTDWEEGQSFDPEQAQLMFAAAHESFARAPQGKRAVTVSAFTEASQWFAFHEDETELERQDQMALEGLWERLHAALPELGGGVEVIETWTPRSFYDVTRRKLGMVGGIGQSLEVFGPLALTHRTALPNLFMVGDTVFPGQGVAAVTQSALIVANEIAPPAER